MISTRYPQFIDGLHRISPHYKAILCDIWGVLHGGGDTVFPAAHQALKAFRQRGEHVKIILISNGPYPYFMASRYLKAKGLAPNMYDDIVTAGDITQIALSEKHFGTRCFFIGKQRDRHFLERGKLEDTPLEQAEFALVAGLENEFYDYTDLLRALKERDLTLVCANPDHVVKMGSSLFPCAGFLAHTYEGLGGKVIYFGKPYPAIYAQAFLKLKGIEKNECLAIGDSLSTDIQGAQQAGIDSLFIAGGIHAHACFAPDGTTLDREKTCAIFQEKWTPTYAMSYLS